MGNFIPSIIFISFLPFVFQLSAVEGIDPVRGVKVSDGQRRRVQICMGLLLPFKRRATIVYATHIFDGLETWATHLAYIQDGELKRAEKLLEIDELKDSVNLLSVVEAWLRSESKKEKRKTMNPPDHNQKASSFESSPFVSSRHVAYYR